jgi:hypothetical protein
MSAETELQALLVADSGVRAALSVASAARAGERIAADRIEQSTLRPFAVYTRTQTDRFEGLDGTVHATKVTLELQLWADTRLEAEALANACQTALNLDGHAITGRSAGYDGELDLEACLLTLEWWE